MPQIDIVLTDSFPILSLTLISEPFRVANRELLEQFYQWRLLSISGGKIACSSGLVLDTEPLDSRRSDIVILLSAYHPETALVAPLLSWLKRKSHQGAMMCCVDTAALIFAEAGLLAHTPAAAHFEVLPGYRAKFSEKLFVDRLFDVSERRCSSAGGIATCDMTLGLIERFSDRETALRVAEVLTYRPSGHSGQQQKLLTDTSISRINRDLACAVDLMLTHLDSPLPVKDISTRIGVPVWTLNRLFQRYLRQTPSGYYRHLRLSQARDLLRNSHFRINEIARLCGFENPETFARSYKRKFGITASRERIYGS